MTRRTNAKIAGFTFLFYIAAGITSMVLSGDAKSGQGTAAKLANLALHTNEFGFAIILDVLCCFSALVLGVTLYALTRDEDQDIALFGLSCRVGEGVIGAAGLPKSLGLLWLVTADAGSSFADPATLNSLGAFLLMPVGSSTISATFFAVGSAVFSFLLLRGRLIPSALAGLGIVASILLVVVLPLQLGKFLEPTWFEWMPMLVFEIIFAGWLLVKGVDAKNVKI